MNETSARKRRDEHACPASATRLQPAVREAALAAKRSQPIDPNEMPSRIDTAMSTRKRDRMRGVSDVRLRSGAAFGIVDARGTAAPPLCSFESIRTC
ncbi:hypothetical protein ISG21_35645, partial [Burkholderia pseudomallei]|nr:hypothetical protein [Burkholderia pseudomallei]